MLSRIRSSIWSPGRTAPRLTAFRGAHVFVPLMIPQSPIADKAILPRKMSDWALIHYIRGTYGSLTLR